MRNTEKRSGKKMPECSLPQNDVVLDLLNWVGRKIRGRGMVIALKRVRRSYLGLLYGRHITEDESSVAHYSYWDNPHEVEKGTVDATSHGSRLSLEWCLARVSGLGSRIRPR